MRGYHPLAQQGSETLCPPIAAEAEREEQRLERFIGVIYRPEIERRQVCFTGNAGSATLRAHV